MVHTFAIHNSAQILVYMYMYRMYIVVGTLYISLNTKVITTLVVNMYNIIEFSTNKVLHGREMREKFETTSKRFSDPPTSTSKGLYH